MDPWALTGLTEATPTGTNSVTTAKVNFTNLIAQGTARNQRIGNKIFVKQLKLKGMVWASTAATAGNEVYVSYLVIRIKDSQGSPTSAVSTAPTLDQIFEYVGQSGSKFTGNQMTFAGTPAGSINNSETIQLASMISRWKYYSNRWKDDWTILMHKVIKVSKETGVNAEKKMWRRNININQPAFWDDSGNWQDGHILMYWWVDNPTQTGAGIAVGDNTIRPAAAISYRLTYRDE